MPGRKTKETAIHKLDQIVGSRLSMARKEMKKTQTEVGEAIGVTYQQVGKYENGINSLDVSKFKLLSDYFDKPLEWFLKPIEEEK